VPIHPVDCQVARLGGKDLNGESVGRTRMKSLMNFKLKSAKGAFYGGCVRDLFAVEPDVGPVVDSGEVQPSIFSLIAGGNFEFGAIPPGTAVRTVLGHGIMRKI